MPRRFGRHYFCNNNVLKGYYQDYAYIMIMQTKNFLSLFNGPAEPAVDPPGDPVGGHLASITAVDRQNSDAARRLCGIADLASLFSGVWSVRRAVFGACIGLWRKNAAAPAVFGFLILAGAVLFSITGERAPVGPAYEVSGPASLLPITIPGEPSAAVAASPASVVDIIADAPHTLFAEASADMAYAHADGSTSGSARRASSALRDVGIFERDAGAALFRFTEGRVAFATAAGEVAVERLSVAAPASFFAVLPNAAEATTFNGLNPASASIFRRETAFSLWADGIPPPKSPLWEVSLWAEALSTPLPGAMCAGPEVPYTEGVEQMLREVGLRAPLPGRGFLAKYRVLAESYAKKYALPASLILAVMHTESNFNPRAVSSGNALGLMQIVQSTAGNEVYRYLEGSSGTPSVETLFTPEHNIQYGATYLHLLNKRYFQDVADSESRVMCIIAAYNGGPGAVLRSFDADRDKAVESINGMTSEEVYAHLTTRLRSAETRRYVALVLDNQRNYIQ